MTTTHSTDRKILMFLNALRGVVISEQERVCGVDIYDTSHHIITEIFLKGNCGNLALMLIIMLGPDIATAWDIGGHVITKVGNKYYDITGDVTDRYKNAIKDPITYNQLANSCETVVNNYSFALRGPII